MRTHAANNSTAQGKEDRPKEPDRKGYPSMTPPISFRPSVTREMKELLPQMAADAVLWMTQHCPDVDFSSITWEATGGHIKSRYFHETKSVLVCHSGFVGFYRRACRDIKGLKEKIGTYHPSFVTTSIIVHELTHHVQYERNFHKGNETDTALNELCWMREHRPGLFLRCFSGKPPEIAPATIRPKKLDRSFAEVETRLQ